MYADNVKDILDLAKNTLNILESYVDTPVEVKKFAILLYYFPRAMEKEMKIKEIVLVTPFRLVHFKVVNFIIFRTLTEVLIQFYNEQNSLLFAIRGENFDKILVKDLLLYYMNLKDKIDIAAIEKGLRSRLKPLYQKHGIEV